MKAKTFRKKFVELLKRDAQCPRTLGYIGTLLLNYAGSLERYGDLTDHIGTGDFAIQAFNKACKEYGVTREEYIELFKDIFSLDTHGEFNPPD